MRLLLSRRVNCAAWAIGIACVFYGAYSLFILDRIDHLIYRFGPPDPTAPLDPEVARLLPLTEIALIGSILPVTLSLHALHVWLRRRHRARHDLCVECGHLITDWHGRCAGCGVRIGPDPDVVVHVIRG